MKFIKLALVLVFAVVAGCAQQSAPEVSMFQGERIQLEAQATPGLIDAEVVVRIDGQTVIKQRSKAFGGSSQTFRGQWKGYPVTARATQVTQFFSSYLMVDVFIDGQLVDTLTV